MKIYYTCVNLVRESLNYKFPEQDIDSKKDPDEKPIAKEDHAVDGLRYLLMGLPDDPDLLLAESYEPNITTRPSSYEYNEWHWDEELEDRYSHEEQDWLSYV